MLVFLHKDIHFFSWSNINTREKRNQSRILTSLNTWFNLNSFFSYVFSHVLLLLLSLIDYLCLFFYQSSSSKKKTENEWIIKILFKILLCTLSLSFFYWMWEKEVSVLSFFFFLFLFMNILFFVVGHQTILLYWFKKKRNYKWTNIVYKMTHQISWIAVERSKCALKNSN